jgi:hypothetical protein
MITQDDIKEAFEDMIVTMVQTQKLHEQLQKQHYHLIGLLDKAGGFNLAQEYAPKPKLVRVK